MYQPMFRKKPNGVPILGKKDIDAIGERLVADFNYKAMLTPTEIDIDRFAHRYLGMKIDYRYLSHCGCYLGMTVFNDTDEIPVYNPELNCAEMTSAEAHTMIIDNSLLEDSQEHRYRFTAGHECSHDIFHAGYFGYDPNQICMFSNRVPMVQCRIDTRGVKKKPVAEWTDADRMEWQANYGASAILMPRRMVQRLVEKVPVTNYAEMIMRVSDTFNVSFEAAQIRLKDVGRVPTDVNVPTAAMDFIDSLEAEPLGDRFEAFES